MKSKKAFLVYQHLKDYLPLLLTLRVYSRVAIRYHIELPKTWSAY